MKLSDYEFSFIAFRSYWRSALKRPNELGFSIIDRSSYYFLSVVLLVERTIICFNFCIIRLGRFTGGEPLAQKRCQDLLNKLLEAGYRVSLETSGAMDISQVDERVSRVLDLKTPDSGEAGRNLWSNLDVLTTHDQVKFVLNSREDYEWALAEIRERKLDEKLDILFSPVWGQIKPTELAEWVLSDHLNIRVQVQLHKLLWGDQPGK